MGLEMNRQDLLERYQLASMYNQCYRGQASNLLGEIHEKYRKVTGGEQTFGKRVIQGEPGEKDPIWKIQMK